MCLLIAKTGLKRDYIRQPDFIIKLKKTDKLKFLNFIHSKINPIEQKTLFEFQKSLNHAVQINQSIILKEASEIPKSQLDQPQIENVGILNFFHKLTLFINQLN